MGHSDGCRSQADLSAALALRKCLPKVGKRSREHLPVGLPVVPIARVTHHLPASIRCLPFSRPPASL